MEKEKELIINEPHWTILAILLDGRFYPISDLAYMTGLTTEKTRAYVSELIGENIIDIEDNGRHAYYGIDNSETAEAVKEALSSMPVPEIRPLKQNPRKKAVGYARTCYSHLAGELGIKLADALVEQGIIGKGDKGFYVTDKGEIHFRNMQIDVQNLRGYNKKCLDWTERRHHIAGPLGKTLVERFLDLGWIERVSESRSLKVTNEGKKALKNKFAIVI
ncbi:transcriptional regulator [Virgibacillus doumboii]|uniref:transcriptional regulator n=1 Tax=Virgibacillus doumboii TaxID=2697503 RepID=UPI0013DE7BE1|nr:transcriptional regulator [Virgibacillus doumboii]